MGRRVYTRTQGRFILVIEAQLGSSNRPPGQCVGPQSGPPCAIPSGPPPGFDPNRPDVQVMLGLPGIGDLDPSVCDNGPQPEGGGVPGFDPSLFYSEGMAITQAMQDISCKFEDRGVTMSSEACTRSPFGLPAFMTTSGTQRQYCFLISDPAAFRDQETPVSVRVRDNRGNLGPRTDFVIRVLP
jgi:hypothetical protein